MSLFPTYHSAARHLRSAAKDLYALEEHLRGKLRQKPTPKAVEHYQAIATNWPHSLKVWEQDPKGSISANWSEDKVQLRSWCCDAGQVNIRQTIATLCEEIARSSDAEIITFEHLAGVLEDCARHLRDGSGRMGTVYINP